MRLIIKFAIGLLLIASASAQEPVGWTTYKLMTRCTARYMTNLSSTADISHRLGLRFRDSHLPLL